ncbi:MAG TPA: hypothetical protein VFG62_26045 [Rhodopila sp.]|nr:hypothetical protein [Rhodopila sp.]
MSKKAAFRALKCNSDGHITIACDIRARAWRGGASATIAASVNLTIVEAKALAVALLDEAEAAEQKVAKKEAAEARRQKWREKEIAAGRMVVMTASQVFAR